MLKKNIVCLSVCLPFFESADARDLGLMTLFFTVCGLTPLYFQGLKSLRRELLKDKINTARFLSTSRDHFKASPSSLVKDPSIQMVHILTFKGFNEYLARNGDVLCAIQLLELAQRSNEVDR